MWYATTIPLNQSSTTACFRGYMCTYYSFDQMTAQYMLLTGCCCIDLFPQCSVVPTMPRRRLRGRQLGEYRPHPLRKSLQALHQRFQPPESVERRTRRPQLSGACVTSSIVTSIKRLHTCIYMHTRHWWCYYWVCDPQPQMLQIIFLTQCLWHHRWPWWRTPPRRRRASHGQTRPQKATGSSDGLLVRRLTKLIQRMFDHLYKNQDVATPSRR